jgi:hypothetical protein
MRIPTYYLGPRSLLKSAICVFVPHILSCQNYHVADLSGHERVFVWEMVNLRSICRLNCENPGLVAAVLGLTRADRLACTLC